jgi:predicted secreted protein
MGKVAFVAHCVLNQNSRVLGGAYCPGVYSPFVDELRTQGWELAQMPCPELGFAGLNRFWAVREQYDTLAFRRHCRRIVDGVAGAIVAHLERGDEVVIVGVDGSPTMGVHLTSSDPERGGRPEWPDGADELSEGAGILVEELLAELSSRGVEAPRAIGVKHAQPDRSPDAERAELAAFLED